MVLWLCGAELGSKELQKRQGSESRCASCSPSQGLPRLLARAGLLRRLRVWAGRGGHRSGGAAAARPPPRLLAAVAGGGGGRAVFRGCLEVQLLTAFPGGPTPSTAAAAAAAAAKTAAIRAACWMPVAAAQRLGGRRRLCCWAGELVSKAAAVCAALARQAGHHGRGGGAAAKHRCLARFTRCGSCQQLLIYPLQRTSCLLAALAGPLLVGQKSGAGRLDAAPASCRCRSSRCCGGG